MSISLYFHIPFCRRRCGYCDFNTFAGFNSLIPEYIAALCQEVSEVGKTSPKPITVQTIFFGGGTPSLLTISQYREIMEQIEKEFQVMPGAEITLEANPGTVTKEYLQDLYRLGFNRISFGMQSGSPDDLRILDREHTFEDVVNAVKWSKQSGFEHINLDLIFGIPNQTIPTWQRSLELALGMHVDHLSLYSLSVEEGTPLKKWIDSGLQNEPDEDLAGEMYEYGMNRLTEAGYEQYEISNFSTGGESQCRHNLQYWRFGDYLGFGAGAHGFVENTRIENASAILDYINLVKKNEKRPFPVGPASIQASTLTKWERIQENMMVSLRLTIEGIGLEEFQDQYGESLIGLFHRQIYKLTRKGLLEFAENGNTLRLTRKGRLLGNQVFEEFVGNRVPKNHPELD